MPSLFLAATNATAHPVSSASVAPSPPALASDNPATWLSPYPELTPFPGPSTGTELPIWSYLIQLVIVTAVMTAIAYYALRFLRDRVPGLNLAMAAPRNLKVIERVMVDQNRVVFIVAVGKRHWLLASTNEHVTTVAELTPDDLEGDFASTLASVQQPGQRPAAEGRTLS